MLQPSMRLSTRSVAKFAVLFVSALILGGCGNPTADKPAAEVSEAVEIDVVDEAGQSDSGVEPVAPGVVYTFTENSGIDFEGYKVTGPHVGGFGDFEGRVTIPDEDIEAAKIAVEFDMASTYSDNPDLTNRLLGRDFFEVQTYPKASFISTGIELFPDGNYSVTGNLELHGVTKSVTFPASIALVGGVLTAEAEFTINRFDWNIMFKGMADDLIRKDVLILFEIEAVAEAN